MKDLYLMSSQLASKQFTQRYSTSFSLATRMFDSRLRPHIYAIYGLTRIADEVVDTYRGDDAVALLDNLEAETLAAIDRKYSTNPLIHSYQETANAYGISGLLIKPFFASMRSDLQAKSYTEAAYQRYIYGSAEVVGLMCLRVFCENDVKSYNTLETAAAKLGAAYQKINFLRDMRLDYEILGRFYFPIGTYDSFNDATKQHIIDDINADLAIAVPAIARLPKTARRAVRTSYCYYSALLNKLSNAPVDVIKTSRIRIPNTQKLFLLAIAGGRK